MIYKREIIPKGSTIEWGYVFKECAESENELFVLMLGVSAELNLTEIEASFNANEWAAIAICVATPSMAGKIAYQGIAQETQALPAGGEDHMRIAQAVMGACQRAVDKSRPFSNINLKNVVESALRQD